MRTVLEQGGQFSGINRKVQLKPTKWGPPPPAPLASEASGGGAAASGEDKGGGGGGKEKEKDGGKDGGGKEGGKEGGAKEGGAKEGGRAASGPVVQELLLILKWGGVLTHAGRKQAEDLGKSFRMVMYPR